MSRAIAMALAIMAISQKPASVYGQINDDLLPIGPLTTPFTRPFGSQLAKEGGAFGKLDAGLGTFA
jgi:hypothetical protein